MTVDEPPRFRTHRIGVPGEPARYQMRLTLESVGEDWDGTYKPLAEMTYDPPKEGDSNCN